MNRRAAHCDKSISHKDRSMPRIPPLFRNHYPGVIALIAVAIGALFWIWVRQDTTVTLNVFVGWRQAVIVGCAGLAFGGLMAELAALVARSSPGETPVGSAVITGMFALSSQALLILLGLALLH
jgi:hypothetical protein